MLYKSLKNWPLWLVLWSRVTYAWIMKTKRMSIKCRCFYIFSLFFTQNILLYSDLQESTFDMRQMPTRRFEAMDHFSKCFLIVKLKREQETDVRAGRDWRAMRVDLVAPPLERFAYALLGWSGSTVRAQIYRSPKNQAHISHMLRKIFRHKFKIYIFEMHIKCPCIWSTQF